MYMFLTLYVMRQNLSLYLFLTCAFESAPEKINSTSLVQKTFSTKWLEKYLLRVLLRYTWSVYIFNFVCDETESLSLSLFLNLAFLSLSKASKPKIFNVSSYCLWIVYYEFTRVAYFHRFKQNLLLIMCVGGPWYFVVVVNYISNGLHLIVVVLLSSFCHFIILYNTRGSFLITFPYHLYCHHPHYSSSYWHPHS